MAILRLIIRATRGRREIIKADNLGECHPGHAFFQHGKNYLNTEKIKISLRQEISKNNISPIKTLLPSDFLGKSIYLECSSIGCCLILDF